jgi:minimal CRISPR polymerase domain
LSKIHLLCSTNWNPDPGRMLAPLHTMIEHLNQNNHQLDKLILIRGEQDRDSEYCSLVQKELADRAINSSIYTPKDNGSPAKIANRVSNAAEEALQNNAELWVDLTPGPKQRAATIFAAASAVTGVKIMYAESRGGGPYEVIQLDPLDSYNQWLGRWGLRIRNYPEELQFLAKTYEDAYGDLKAEWILSAVSDLLGAKAGFDHASLSLSAALLPFSERTARVIIPLELFGIPSSSGWNENGWDEKMRKLGEGKEWERSAGRASQVVYQLRCLFAHGDKSGRTLIIQDALVLLDCLAFLSSRLQSLKMSLPGTNQVDAELIFIAVDGDDVGRRFEEQLAECVAMADAIKLREWSHGIQQKLSEEMVTLMDKWEGRFIARTGDGFLASVPSHHFDELKTDFRPKLQDETATTGIGRTVKEAYLALKLGKARNRGGGIFFSFDPPREEILW